MKKLLLQAAVLGLVLFGIVELFDVLKPDTATTDTKEVVEQVVETETPEETAETTNEEAPEKTTVVVKPVLPTVNAEKIVPAITVEEVDSEVVVENTETPVVLNSTAVEVFAYEYDFDFSKKVIPAGQVIFTVRNTGVTSHNFAIEGKEDFGKVNPGDVKTFVTELSAGEWEVYSSKTRDADAGMRETLTIR